MKYIFSFFLVLSSILTYGQYDFDRNDFFEIGVAYNSSIKSDYHVYSSYTEQRNDQGIADGSIPKNNYQVNLRYGKAITSFAHVVLGVGYENRKELINDEVSYKGEVQLIGFALPLQTINYNFGIRLKCIQTEKIEFSIAGGGQAFHTIGAPDDLIAGYYGRGILGFNFNERIQLNVKYGYQSTAGKYLYNSRPAELALHYKIY